MYWNGSRREKLIYRQVSFPSMDEGKTYNFFTDGSLELSAFTSLRVSGTLNYCTYGEPKQTHDLIRIYYAFTDQYGTYGSYPLATMFLGSSEPTINGKMISGTVELFSVLKVAENKYYGLPYTIKAGTNAVAKAVELMESLGLKTNNPKCDYKLSADHVFKTDESYLSIVNWLLNAANYTACYPDAYGIVQMLPYQKPDMRQPVWTFSDGDDSIMQPCVVLSDNSQDIPNACRLNYETDEESLWASTVNVDKTSNASVVSKKYESTLTETISELSGNTQEERLNNLKELSRNRLIDNSAVIEYVSLQHPYVPIYPADAICIDYKAAGSTWSGSVTNIQISLATSMQCQSKARRFIRKNLDTKTQGGTY